ncbi:ABC transporter permease subunit [Sneathiella chungangensis]|uniref:Glutamate/aspartate import permease protein GltK n=1 Tax=Sneathiella chungangensis TaxID=1418234 RepID=A0A845M928_9PROT|nr:amino acid ABC transporter permease [Sneathiella chungangensis]MZR21183.1 ABC transporter permease subunit [Sneathiella chungangensis]
MSSIVKQSSDDAFKDKYHYPIATKFRYGRYLAAAIILFIAILIVHAFVVGKIDWGVVREYLFARSILTGIVNTVVLTIISMFLGISFGLIAALMRGSSNLVVRNTALFYIFFFRSVPVLLQLLIWYNLALIFPTIAIPGLFSIPMTEVATPFVAAVLAFGISQGAYTSEVIRSGLLSVDRGQAEAAKSLGMTKGQTLRRIIIPQAMRVIVPPVGNETIGMVKYTSLASIIQYREIIYSAQTIYFANAQVIELLFVCAFWYLVVVSILSFGQMHIERYYNRSSRDTAKGETKK